MDTRQTLQNCQWAFRVVQQPCCCSGAETIDRPEPFQEYLQASDREDSRQGCLLATIQIQAANDGHRKDDDREVRRDVDGSIRAVGLLVPADHLGT